MKPTAQGSILIVEVWDHCNFRKLHDPRKRAQELLKGSRGGRAILAINNSCTAVRIYDSVGGVHHYWAPKGFVFDVTMIQRMVSAMRLRIVVTPRASKDLRIAA